MAEIHEKCAVVGVFDPNAAELTALALRKLDHRGPDSTGIGGITETGTFEAFRSPGKAKDVLTDDRVARLGTLGLVATVGHGRYPTSGGVDTYHPIAAGRGTRQIFYVENGNASDLSALEADLGRRNIATGRLNDSEMATQAIADRRRRGASLVDAIADTYPLLVGAHSSIVAGMGPDGEPTLAAFRDSCGIRPLVWGRTESGGYVFASETVGLDAAGASYSGDVAPGSMMTVSHEGTRTYELATPTPKFDPFELIYFSNKNSLFKGHRIGDIRAALGAMLAVEYGDAASGNVVVGIPNSANTYAEGYADALDLEYRKQAITKNKVDRTFMQMTKQGRQELRDQTYNFDRSQLQGEDLDVIDDSLVRNNTAPYNTRKLRELGARSVNVYIGSPPIRFPNFYGVDIPDQNDLVASHMSMEEIRKTIKCERLGYLSLEGMLDVFFGMTGETADNFDLSCFTGDYPISIGNRDIRAPSHIGNAA